VALSLILIAVGVGLGVWLDDRDGGPVFAKGAGISEFAVLYILAQALERLAEFVAYIPGIGASLARKPEERYTKARAIKERNTSLVAGYAMMAEGKDNEAREKANNAANCQHRLDVIRHNRAVFFFGLITLVAAVAVGHFKMLLLQMVGVTRLWPGWDIAVTALAIGGGTKPLHDLIANLQKSKEEREDASGTGPIPI
jgi:hypothetical protein